LTSHGLNRDSTVVICAHNEEHYIRDCLTSILKQNVHPSLIIVVADRCTDRTQEIARSVLDGSSSIIIEKNVSRWRNSISENLELARAKCLGSGFAVIDADMVVPPDFLGRLLPQLSEYGSVSALAKTDPSAGLLNRLVSWWELTYRVTPMGEQPRGGARAISKLDLDAIGGFRDVIAWETDVDNRLRAIGRLVKLDTTFSVLHRRRMTIRNSVSYQIHAGRARRELGISFSRTLLHSFFRLRPFVVYGYLKAGEASERQRG
jgi:glycosyltransferase involved in cell wall biosynthesis